MPVYPEPHKPLEEFRCIHCQSSSVEFEIHNIYTVDNFNQRVNERVKREIRCSQCGCLPIVVKLDIPKAMQEEEQKQNNLNIPDTVNEVYVEEVTDRRRAPPINLTASFEGNRPINLRQNTHNLKPFEEFKKTFKGF